MVQKRSTSRIEPVMTKLKDITNSVREILSCNTKTMKQRHETKNTVKKNENEQHNQGKVERETKGGNQQVYELQPLNTRNYDHYFRNNTRFYNYQRTRQISENSDPEQQHYQISAERCLCRFRDEDTTKRPGDNTKKPSNRSRSTTTTGQRNSTNSQNPNKLQGPTQLMDNPGQDLDKNNNKDRDCKDEVQSSKVQVEGQADREQSLFGELETSIIASAKEDLEPKPFLPAYVQKPYQLMHPDWRWIPHVPLYGWTPLHEQNIRRLYDEMAEGRITSMYYKDASEYEEYAKLYQSLRKSNNFLKKPTVSTLEEVFELIKKTIQQDDRFTRPRRTSGSKFNSEDNGYDADIEETVI